MDSHSLDPDKPFRRRTWHWLTHELRQALRKNVFIRYLFEFHDLKVRLLLGNIFAIVQAVSLIPISLLFKRIIDVYIPQKDASAIGWVIAVGLGLWAVHIGATVASRYFTLSSTKTVTERLRARLVMHLQQMSLRFYDKERISELHPRVVMDTERVDVMANALVVTVLVSAVVALASAVLLLMINARLALLVFVMVPLYYVIQRTFSTKLKEGHRSFRKEMEQMSSIVHELLHSIRLVKSFAREPFEQERVQERIRRVTHRGVRLFTETAAFQILLQFVGGLALLVIFTVGAWMTINDRMTLGEIVAFSSLLAYFLNPINTLIGCVDTIYAGRAGLESVYGLLDIYDTEKSDHLPRIDVQGAVEFQNVCFEYRKGEAVLHNVSFRVQSGEQVALVGASGAGKTTVANMILGFYFPTEGRVLIDEHDITKVNLRALREQIGVVSQDNILISGSVLNNIRYGKMDATFEEIVAAAKLANAHDFITGLPDGYDTDIGDRGVRLSGGQKQRIAIARAILKNPKILVLDEATSALDSESEAVVQEALKHLRHNRTCFIIAHRLSTIIEANRIFVLKRGHLVEAGNFEELMARKGEFFRYYQLQFKTKEQVANTTVAI
ncbi:MAG: ABC transporter ATP-binding protein [Candidatus Hydrogenedentota bacterium]|nr:MAG: ABC transporter ATP-binding protein [Candidatus Hydrogenedentota bacterium]